MINPTITGSSPNNSHSVQLSSEHSPQANHIQQSRMGKPGGLQSGIRHAKERHAEGSKGIAEPLSAQGTSLTKEKIPADQSSASISFGAILSGLSAEATDSANTSQLPAQKNVPDAKESIGQMAEISNTQSDHPANPLNLSNSTSKNSGGLGRALAKQMGVKPDPKSTALSDVKPVNAQAAENSSEIFTPSTTTLEAETNNSTQKNESSDPITIPSATNDTISHADLLVAMLQLPPRDIQSPPPKGEENDGTNQPATSSLESASVTTKHQLAASNHQPALNNSNAPHLAISSSMEAVNLINPENKPSLPSLVGPDAAPTITTAMPSMHSNSNLPGQQQGIAAPLSSNNWANEFSQKINWMSMQQNYVAELFLNPPDLGALDVVLSVSGNQADALFTSPHSAVREAVENAMPKLRELLADNGINLGNATVSDQPLRDRDQERFMRQNPDNITQSNNSSKDSKSENLLPTDAKLISIRRHLGMVDTFA